MVGFVSLSPSNRETQRMRSAQSLDLGQLGRGNRYNYCTLINEGNIIFCMDIQRLYYRNIFWKHSFVLLYFSLVKHWLKLEVKSMYFLRVLAC